MFFLFYKFVSLKVCLGLICWFLGVNKVQGTTKEEFIIIIVHVEMQRHHLYIACHVTMVAKVVIVY
jgi:hypothetical protein